MSNEDTIKKVREIADYRGYITQSRQIIEEMSEAIESVVKLSIDLVKGYYYPIGKQEEAEILIESLEDIRENANSIKCDNKKYREKDVNIPVKIDYKSEAVSDILEELADVQIMIWQMQYLLKDEESLTDIMEYKVNREIERINNTKRS